MLNCPPDGSAVCFDVLRLRVLAFENGICSWRFVASTTALPKPGRVNQSVASTASAFQPLHILNHIFFSNAANKHGPPAAGRGSCRHQPLTNKRGLTLRMGPRVAACCFSCVSGLLRPVSRLVSRKEIRVTPPRCKIRIDSPVLLTSAAGVSRACS